MLSDANIAMLIAGFMLLGYGAYFGCRQLSRVWSSGPTVRLNRTERAWMALNLATSHFGGTLIALACNPLHPTHTFSTTELAINNVAWPAVYFASALFSRRLYVAGSADRYTFTWRDSRDILFFMGGMGAIALAGM